MVSKNVKAKGLGVNVSSSDGKPAAKAGEVTKGSTGVELSWHEPSKFKLLTKEQKVELAAWNKSNPRRIVPRRNARLMGQIPSSPKLKMS